MKVLILGHGQHGKDTVGAMLDDEYDLKSISSSLFALHEAVWPTMCDQYDNKIECFDDRHNRRQEWFDLITAYNTPDKARLVKGLLKTHDVYTGLRCKEEYEAAKEYFGLILWVDRHLFVPLEDTMKIKFNDEMVWINNNSDLGYTLWQIQRLRIT